MALCLAAVLLLAAEDRPTLNVLAPGINSRGTDLFDDVAAVRERGQTFRIQLVGEKRPGDRPGLVNYACDGGEDPPGTQLISIRRLDDPALEPFLRRVNAARHATVVLDMAFQHSGIRSLEFT